MTCKIRRNEIEEGVILSTVKPFAWAWYGKYETAVTFNNQETWKVLKGYDTEEEAIKGHEEFLKKSVDELASLKDAQVIIK